MDQWAQSLLEQYQKFDIDFKSMPQRTKKSSFSGSTKTIYYPHMTKTGADKLSFVTVLEDPQYFYENVLQVLDFLPRPYRERLPSGRPTRDLFPASGTPLENIDLSLKQFKFPPGRQIGHRNSFADTQSG